MAAAARCFGCLFASTERSENVAEPSSGETGPTIATTVRAPRFIGGGIGSDSFRVERNSSADGDSWSLLPLPRTSYAPHIHRKITSFASNA